MSTPLLDRATAEEAILEHFGLPLTASSQPPGTFERSFVEYGEVLRTLSSGDWHVVFGAPGTGKTTLLRLLQERERNRISDRPATQLNAGVLPVYVDAKDAVVSPLRGLDVPDVDKTIAFFQRFLERLGNDLVSTVGSLKQTGGLFARMSRPGAKVKRANKLVREVLAIAGDPEPLYPLFEERIEDDSEVREAMSSSIEASAQLKAALETPPRAGGSAKKRATRGTERNKRRVTHRSGRGVPRYSDITDHFEDLVAALELRRVDILIDNWTALDDTGTSAIQPLFGHLLLSAFGGTSAISVKIAADGYQTRFYDETASRGLRRDTDIFVAENLNEALLDDDELVRFFELLLFLRMINRCRALRVFLDQDRPMDRAVSPAFIESIFESRAAFELLVKGTEGRCRQFLMAFNKLAHIKGFQVDQRWTVADVHSALNRGVRLRVQELEYQSPAVRLLIARVKPKVTAHRNPVFVLSGEQDARLKPFLQELVQKQLVRQELADDVLPKAAAMSSVAYSVEEPVLREWERALRFEQVRAGTASNAELSIRKLRGAEVDFAGFSNEELAPWTDAASDYDSRDEGPY